MPMHEHTSDEAPAPGVTIGSVSAILILIAALFAVDFFLAKTDQAEVRQEATHFYNEGSRLLREGKAAEAEEMLRRAHALARGNRQYQLQLVAALLATAKSREAENLLQDLLRKEPNDGRANLLATRLAVQAGRTADAESYYHRAIYGVWHEKPAAHRMEVRLELIDLLAARHAEKELLAELLPLEAEAPDDRAMRQRIASLYLVAGSPARSERAFRALIQDDPINAEAYAGLGEAELALGNYPGAQAAFRAALVRNPGDHATRQRLELARNLTELDPTPRRLSSSEKYRRSITILQRAADALERCTTQSQGSASEDSAQLLAAAAKALTKRPRGVITNELSEEKLSLGEQLWRARAKLCPAAPSEEVLSLIMDKLSQ